MKNDRTWDRLKSLLREMGSAVIAYSGGVDSTLLLKAAAEVLGPNFIAVTARSETYPPEELEAAHAFARSLGVSHRIIASNELELEDFVRNAPDRCYHCKHELFGRLRAIADAEGISHLLDGSNTDDLNDYRPGRKAAEEFGVRSPLIEAGLSKQDIRGLARQLGLAVWDKPSMACLSSRIPYGTRISPALLGTIHAAETVVRGYGVRQVRVRHHGDIARIEIDADDFERLTMSDNAGRLADAIKQLGYRYVCLDLEGYRTGSMNGAAADGAKMRAGTASLPEKEKA